MIHYYKISFYKRGDVEEQSYCIKTEIRNLSIQTAIKILFGDNPSKEQQEMCANADEIGIYEIPEESAKAEFDVEELTKCIVDEKGAYYKRKTEEERAARAAHIEYFYRVKAAQNLLKSFDSIMREYNDVLPSIKRVRNMLEEIQQYREIGTVEECKNAVEKVVSLEQLKWERDVAEQQLAEIGLSIGAKMDDVKKAMEKQKPMCPNRTGSDEQDAYTCPNCGSEVCYLDDAYDEFHFNYCPDCGQALQWESKL